MKRDEMKKLSSLGSALILILMLLAALFICMDSLFYTAYIDPEQYRAEHILYKSDSVITNLAVIAIVFVLLLFFVRSELAKKINVTAFAAAVAVISAIMAAVWVLSVASVPEADSYNVTTAAAAAVNEDFSWLIGKDSYFKSYQYQLGYVLYSELLQSIFGVNNYRMIAAANALMLGLAYFGISLLSNKLFNHKEITLAVSILELFCLQPLFFCTFLYGNIPGFALAVWAAYFLADYFVKEKIPSMIFSVLLCAAAVVLKPNYGIFAIAFVILALLKLFCATAKNKACLLAFMLAAALLPGIFMSAVKLRYEKLSGENLGEDMPLTAWLAMGLSESERAPGWYNPYLGTALRKADYDRALISESAKEDVLGRVRRFADDREYAERFFTEKFRSQWQETSFEGIWLSKVKPHEAELPAFAEEIYYGKTGEYLLSYFDHYTQAVYFFFAAGLLLMLLKRKEKLAEELLLIPLVVLGAFIYHMLFEAKSQYLLCYIPLMLPFCGYFIGETGNLFKKEVHKTYIRKE